MTDLPSVRAAEAVRALERLGFSESRRRGSHITMRHTDGRWVAIPVHRGRDIDRGLLRTILRQADIDAADFAAALRS